VTIEIVKGGKLQMHPVQDLLRRYCDRDLEPAAAKQVEAHLRRCELCREFCEEYRALGEFVDQQAERPLPTEAQHAASRLYRAGFGGEVVVLRPFSGEAEAAPIHLAADRPGESGPRFENLATFFSEQPEVVLRIMRDNERDQDYLQLVSEDTNLISQVLVEMPDLELSVITDEHGRGVFEKRFPDDARELPWQIKMPEAEFSLLPLQYDPNRVEYSEDIVLETVRKDRVAIRFEGQREGKQISIRILELNGRADFTPVSVAVSQGGKSLIGNLAQDDVLYFDMEGTESTIDIRLFRSR